MNGWEITTVSANGATKSDATVVTRNSPSMVINVLTNANSTDYSIQLPLSPVTGDAADVCVGSTFAQATVWLGIVSSNVNFDTVNTGRCRSYRYINGPSWNVYSS
jgi:hypothetical protein